MVSICARSYSTKFSAHFSVRRTFVTVLELGRLITIQDRRLMTSKGKLSW